MKARYPQEWRSQTPWKKRFYAKYMTWLERIGYLVVAIVIGAFIFAFNYRVDDVISADKVQVMANAHPIKASELTVIVRQLVDNFEDVKTGDPILEVVQGDIEVAQYIAWSAMERGSRNHTLTQPKVTIVRAEYDGVLAVDPALLGVEVKPETELCQIRDYSDLQLTANLAGQGVAQAKSGTTATLKSMTVSSDSGVLFRGISAGSPIVSGRLVSAETLASLSQTLGGLSLNVRDDLPLEVTEVTQLQVDADLSMKSGNSGSGVRVDPAVTATFKADVISGEHQATIQFAKLPPQLQATVNQELEKALSGRSIIDEAGNLQVIGSLSKMNTVFQVAAKPSGASTGSNAVDGAIISRTFQAQLKINDPPSALSEAVRNADAEGQKVTVKVELKTGDRPIATLLLKRS